MTERSRSPPPTKVSEEPTLGSVQDNMMKQFEQIMKQFEQLSGNRTTMKNEMNMMGVRINGIEANTNTKFESLEKRLDRADMAINEIKHVKAGLSGGSGNTWKTRKASDGSAGRDDDVDMGGGGSDAGSSGFPRAGYGTPSQTNPKELGAKFWETPNGMFENKEGHNKGGGVGSNPKPQKKGVQSKCRFWIKGHGRKLTKAVLKAQSDLVLACVNAGLNDDE